MHHIVTHFSITVYSLLKLAFHLLGKSFLEPHKIFVKEVQKMMPSSCYEVLWQAPQMYSCLEDMGFSKMYFLI